MAFSLFHSFFPNLAERETRTFTVIPGDDVGIPEGEYGLLEMFCDEPGCDCRRVFFSVFSTERKRADAVITWGWEDIEFYSRWMTYGSREAATYLKGPSLNVGSPAAVHAPAILSLVREMLLADKPFAQRIQRHYNLFRSRIENDFSTDSGKSGFPVVSPEATHESIPGHKTYRSYCDFCGSTLGHESDRTGGIVIAVYWCRKCRRNYCNECSYIMDGVQHCLRCDSILENVAPEEDVPPHAKTKKQRKDQKKSRKKNRPK